MVTRKKIPDMPARAAAAFAGPPSPLPLQRRKARIARKKRNNSSKRISRLSQEVRRFESAFGALSGRPRWKKDAAAAVTISAMTAAMT